MHSPFPCYRILVMLVVALLTAATAGCSSDEPLTEEDQIRALIEQAEIDAEDRDAGALMDVVDSNFRSGQRYNKDQLEKILRLYFFRHKSIYLFTRIKDIELTASDYAVATVFVAMAGTAISDITAITSMRANIYRFDLEFVKNESWLLSSAKWEIARVEDLQ